MRLLHNTRRTSDHIQGNFRPIFTHPFYSKTQTRIQTRIQTKNSEPNMIPISFSVALFVCNGHPARKKHQRFCSFRCMGLALQQIVAEAPHSHTCNLVPDRNEGEQCDSDIITSRMNTCLHSTLALLPIVLQATPSHMCNLVPDRKADPNPSTRPLHRVLQVTCRILLVG